MDLSHSPFALRLQRQLRTWAGAAFGLVALGLMSSGCSSKPPVAATSPTQPPRTPPPTQPGPMQPPPLAAPLPWLGQLPPLLTPQGWGLPLPAPMPTTASSWSQEEWDVVRLVNGYRARGAFCGAEYFAPTQPLVAHPALQSAARAHSWDMGRRNFYDHTTPEGHGPSDRARAAGYPGGAAENIHVQQTTAYGVVDDWMRSTGHCKNFMNPSYREIGVGHAQVAGSQYGHYWTANMGFGQR